MSECNHETATMRTPQPTRSCRATSERSVKYQIYVWMFLGLTEVRTTACNGTYSSSPSNRLTDMEHYWKRNRRRILKKWSDRIKNDEFFQRAKKKDYF